jgi:hypothetical protein
MNKDITKRNINNYKHGQYHGYQEWYGADGKMWLRGNWKNDDEIGYDEWHYKKQTNFYIR